MIQVIEKLMNAKQRIIGRAVTREDYNHNPFFVFHLEKYVPSFTHSNKKENSD